MGGVFGCRFEGHSLDDRDQLEGLVRRSIGHDDDAVSQTASCGKRGVFLRPALIRAAIRRGMTAISSETPRACA